MADEAQLGEAGLPVPAAQPQTQPDTIGHDNARMRARQGAFLAAYGKTCRVDLAATAADIARQTHYEWLKADPGYAALFEETKALARQILMDEAVSRATTGWLEPVFHNGQQCGQINKRSDRLLERLLEANFPEFRRHVELTGKDGAPLLSLAAVGELIKRIEDGSDTPG